MRRLSFFFILVTALVGGTCITASAQGADSRLPYGRREDPPRGVREMYQKMRIEKERKEYEEMISRADEAAKLASQVELAFSQLGRLSKDDIARVEAVERDVKSVRSKLGGGDSDEKDENSTEPMNMAKAVADLKAASEKLFDEVQRSTRFAISVPAIEASNAVIKAARFLLHK